MSDTLEVVGQQVEGPEGARYPPEDSNRRTEYRSGGPAHARTELIDMAA
jgi:hypothetical protein